jgi:tetratricopeptide (TPR) repeat protein
MGSSLSLAGRVVEEDGKPPKDLVQVDLICNGRIRQHTLTASDGTFQFDMNPANDESWLDASSGGSATGAIEGPVNVTRAGQSTALDEVPAVGRGMVNLTGCEVRLTPQPGVTSNSISLRTRNTFDNPNIGVIVIRRLADSGATTISLNSLNAPKKAQSAFDKANNALIKEKPDYKKALKELKKAISEYPQFSAAWDLLARVHLSQGDRIEGRNGFLKAIEVEPKFIPPYLGIAQLSFQDKNWEETYQWTQKVLELDANNTRALYWNGLASFYSQRYDECEMTLTSLYEQGRTELYPFGLFPLGVVHANQGKIREAVKELELYLKLMPPDQIPEAQRTELEAQISAWKSQGLVPEEESTEEP